MHERENKFVLIKIAIFPIDNKYFTSHCDMLCTYSQSGMWEILKSATWCHLLAILSAYLGPCQSVKKAPSQMFNRALNRPRQTYLLIVIVNSIVLSEGYLEPNRTATMELFCENS